MQVLIQGKKVEAEVGEVKFKDLTTTQQLIYTECAEIANLLIKKNTAYGNSFAEPINIFCKFEAKEQINCRIDDKLNRIAKGEKTEEVEEDTELDLIGYLILKRVLKHLERGTP
jgi:hypothetical protein